VRHFSGPPLKGILLGIPTTIRLYWEKLASQGQKHTSILPN
jgi:hypothetical protein